MADPIIIEAAENLQAWVLRDRQYRLIIEKPFENGTERYVIGAPTADNYAAHIRFQLERTDGKVLNMATINLWNLNNNQIEALLQENTKVYLYAGYGRAVENLPLIFQGTVIQLQEQLSGADREYTVTAVDGFQELAQSTVSMSFVEGTTYKTVFDEIAKRLGIGISYMDGAEEMCTAATVFRGLSFVGKVEAVLNRLADETGLSWAVESGILCIKTPLSLQVGRQTAYHLSAKTGLIGLPRRMFETSVTTNENAASGMRYLLYGYSVQFFMNGALQIRDIVYLDSSVARGLFQIYNMQIQGDNLAGDWICTAKLCEYHPALSSQPAGLVGSAVAAIGKIGRISGRVSGGPDRWNREKE